jgi:hypothetical protein
MVKFSKAGDPDANFMPRPRTPPELTGVRSIETLVLQGWTSWNIPGPPRLMLSPLHGALMSPRALSMGQDTVDRAVVVIVECSIRFPMWGEARNKRGGISAMIAGRGSRTPPLLLATAPKTPAGWWSVV